MPGALFGRERSPFFALGFAVGPVPSGAPRWAGTGAPGLVLGLGDSLVGGDEGGALLPSPELTEHPGVQD